jgi:hypothetical protein
MSDIRYQALIVYPDGSYAVSSGIYRNDDEAKKKFNGPSGPAKQMLTGSHMAGFVRLLTEYPVDVFPVEQRGES